MTLTDEWGFRGKRVSWPALWAVARRLLMLRRLHHARRINGCTYQVWAVKLQALAPYAIYFICFFAPICNITLTNTLPMILLSSTHQLLSLAHYCLLIIVLHGRTFSYCERPKITASNSHLRPVETVYGMDNMDIAYF